MHLGQLTDVVARFSNHPGCRHLLEAVHGVGAPTRSELEDAFLTFCRQYDLPIPLVNTRVAGHEVDALFADERVIVELDGWDFHRDRYAFEDDRERDADTLAVGLVTVRITWERLTHRPDREASRLGAILSSRRR